MKTDEKLHKTDCHICERETTCLQIDAEYMHVYKIAICFECFIDLFRRFQFAAINTTAVLTAQAVKANDAIDPLHVIDALAEHKFYKDLATEQEERARREQDELDSAEAHKALVGEEQEVSSEHVDSVLFGMSGCCGKMSPAEGDDDLRTWLEARRRRAGRSKHHYDPACGYFRKRGEE